jgi:hypothetical protein
VLATAIFSDLEGLLDLYKSFPSSLDRYFWIDQIQELFGMRSYRYYALDDCSHSSDPLAPWVFVPRRRGVRAHPLSHRSRGGGDKTRDGAGF